MALESNPLMTLLRGQQPTRMQLRQQQLRDPRTSPEFEQLVGTEDAEEAARMAADPIEQKYRAIAEGQAAAQTRNVPEIAAMREAELADEERLRSAAARAAGAAGIRQAEIAGPYRVAAAGETAAGKSDVAAQQAASQGENRRAIALRQRLQALQKKGRPGFLREQLFGEGTAYDKELAQIIEQLGIEPGMEPATEPAIESEEGAPVAPPGWQYVRRPGGGWTAIEVQ